MEKSNHKNYVKWYGIDRSQLVRQEIMPYEKSIFDMFSKKFKIDADKDLERGREKLWKLWYLCADSCKNIHKVLAWTTEYSPKIKSLVDEVVNLDYQSLLEVFEITKAEYFDKWWSQEVQNNVQDICKHLTQMREISKNRTNVISKLK